MVLFLAVLALVAFGAVNTSKESEEKSVSIEVKGRKSARIRTRRGINLMMNEQYKDSLEELNRALRADSEFGEGYLARSVTHLALGKKAEAISDATQGKTLLKQNSLDVVAWKQHPNATIQDGQRIADRVICIANEIRGEPLDANDGKRLIRLFREFSVAPDCAGSQQVLERWANEGRVFQIIDRAQTTCGSLWSHCEEATAPNTPEEKTSGAEESAKQDSESLPPKTP